MSTCHAHDGCARATTLRLAVALGLHTLTLLAVSLLLLLGCREEPAADDHDDTAEEPTAAADMGLGPDPAFEWMGVYELPASRVELALQPGPDDTMGVVLLPLAPGAAPPFEDAVAAAREIGERAPAPAAPGTTLEPATHYALQVGGEGEMRFPVDVPAAGRYALFTQHFADEFQTVFRTADDEVVAAGEQRIFKERFGQIAVTPEAQRAFGIEVGAARRQELTDPVAAPARVAFDAERMAHVGSAVEGRVAQIAVRRGDTVSEGDVLLVVESPELGERQSHYLASLAAAEAARPAVELAQQSYDRAQGLYDQTEGGISLTEVQRRQAELAAARSVLIQAEAQVDASANALRLYGMDDGAIAELARTRAIVPRYSVRAPLSGEVVEREVTPGELVGPDDAEPLMVLADTSSVWVLADVPEGRLAELGVGSKARIEVPALPGATFEGEVTYVEPRLNEATRTARLRIEVPNADGKLRPGMFARARLTPAATTTALSVPATAVIDVDGQSVVFVPMADRENTFLKRPVTLGPRAGDVFPVLLGLAEGEPVVTAGVFVLKADLGKSGATHDH